MERNDLVLFADSDCDITLAKANELGYHLISMPFQMEGKEYFPYEDSPEFDFKSFYEALGRGIMPKTSAVSPEKYMRLFEPFFQEGKDIFYVHFSATLSGTFNSLKVAQDMLKAKYPERTIYTFDTKAITAMALMMLYDFSELYNKGKSAQEMITIGEEKILNSYSLYAFADDISYFKRSGRLKGAQATFATILNIKPIISIDDEGYMKAVDKAMGRFKAMRKILENMQAIGLDPLDHRIILCHSNNLENVEHMKKLICEEYPRKTPMFEVVDINPTAVCHCGPSCLGVCFRSKKRTVV